MKLAIGLFLAFWAPDFAAANLRRTQDSECVDCCNKATDQAASIIQSALLGCGQAATGYSGLGSESEESRRLQVSSPTAMAYQPPNPTCLLILCTAQRTASGLVRNACGDDGELVTIGADICEYVPGFTPPIARDDSNTIIQGQSDSFAVLENDSAVPDRYLVLNNITSPATLGTCSIAYNKNNKVVMYTSDGKLGRDSCVYETCYENGPRLCDTATLNIGVIATAAPTRAPTDLCTIGLDITCADCDEKELATKEECTGDKPSLLTLKYNGGKCGQSDNDQPYNFSCEDFNGGPPTQSNASSNIVVTDTDNKRTYWKGKREVGDFVPLKPDGGKYESNLRVVIYDESYTNVLQKVEFHSSCSKPLYLLDKFGSVQIAAFENDKDGLVTVKGSATLNIQVSNNNNEDVIVSRLLLESPEPINFPVKDILAINGIRSFTLPVDSDPKGFLQLVPLDLSVQQTYEYLLDSGGLGDDRRCTGLLDTEFVIPTTVQVG